ncbi:hypothetical protein [Nostoc favosum]|nr:hypothetical protein [Nostoc favosum]
MSRGAQMRFLKYAKVIAPTAAKMGSTLLFLPPVRPPGKVSPLP